MTNNESHHLYTMNACVDVCLLMYICSILKKKQKMNSKCNYDDYVDINRSTYFTLMP